MGETVEKFVLIRRKSNQDQVVEDCAYWRAKINDQNAGHMSSHSQMVRQMRGHRLTVIRHKDEVVLFYPNQDSWIWRSSRWRSLVPDSPDR